jgi:ribosomal protein S18 acetylase RimI-like enzyme
MSDCCKQKTERIPSLVPRNPTVEEFLDLRRAANWPVPAEEAVMAALNNTLFSACIEKDGQCLGNGRVVGDGALTFYIQDLIVHPDYQRTGYGTRLMDALMEYIHANAQHKAFIGLFSATSIEHWYARYGFIKRPTEQLGAGMMLFIT